MTQRLRASWNERADVEAITLIRSGTQRHVDSFKFFSRDVLSRSAMPQLDLDYDDQAVHYGIRVDSFDVTGGLVWLQAEPYATLTPYDIDTSRVVRGST